MPNPRVLVLRAPGTNCDVETAFAFEKAGGATQRVHINRLRENPKLMRDFQILCIPGGFSYGDDVGAGKILAGHIQNHLAEVIAEFLATRKLVLGICNGFQVLLQSGVLLPPDPWGPRATLAWNDSGRFEDRWVRTKVSGSPCVFLQGIDAISLPIAHAEGKFVARDTDVLGSLEQSGQMVLRYCNSTGGAATGFPDNPNGSMANVAGLADSTGHALGLMPHPERHLDATQHPHWTRRQNVTSEGEGCQIFKNAVAFFAT